MTTQPTNEELLQFWTFLNTNKPEIYDGWKNRQDCPVCLEEFIPDTDCANCPNGHYAACSKCVDKIATMGILNRRCTICRKPEVIPRRRPANLRQQPRQTTVFAPPPSPVHRITMPEPFPTRVQQCPSRFTYQELGGDHIISETVLTGCTPTQVKYTSTTGYRFRKAKRVMNELRVGSFTKIRGVKCVILEIS